MNFSQLHERLRIEIVRRIDRGQLTGSLLARQTGLRASHLSNFMRSRRKLSLAALDRVLAAQSLSIDDLLPERTPSPDPINTADLSSVPLVSHPTALHSPVVNRRNILEIVHLPAGMLDQLRPRRTQAKRNWQRFLAVRVTAAQARPMEPILRAGAIVILDRHYNSLAPNEPPRPNVYAVNIADTLGFRYVGYEANRLVLRPHALDYPVELLRLSAEDLPSATIVGRVCFAITEF